ncbi:MAG: ABC transporter substrate-binding protein [Bacilli bacterium]|nr:ABC transporter substrate-binding protein [Bacilli bacterium]
MRKILAWVLIGFAIIALVATLIIENKNNDNDLTKIKVAEVTHSIFYAPQYIAIKNGYFEDNGLDVELILTPGADKVTAAVLSGDVQIGFSGSEATIYVYNGGEEDYLKTFAGLTNKDGSFLVARKKDDNFKIEDLKGKHVIAGRVGGMPVMNFEWALRNNNIDPTKDLNVDTSIEFASMQGAFIGGTGDYVSVFELSVRQ